MLPPTFAADPDRLSRFEQESRAAAALNHPNTAAIHDVGEATDGEATVRYMVQEYLRGAALISYGLTSSTISPTSPITPKMDVR